MAENTIKTRAILFLRKAFPYLWKAAAVFGLLLLLGWCVFLINRNSLLQKAMHQAQVKLLQNYGLEFEYTNADFRGLRTLRIQGISLDARTPKAKADNYPVLLNLADLHLKISLWAMLTGEVALASVQMEKLHLVINEGDTMNNYGKLLLKIRPKDVLPTGNSIENSSETQKNFTDQFEWIWKSMKRLFPEDFRAEKLFVEWSRDSSRQVFDVPYFEIVDGDVSGIVQERDVDVWKIGGELSFRKEQVFLELVSLQKEFGISFLKRNWNFDFSFDTLLFRLDNIGFPKGKPIFVQTSSRVHGLQMQHPRLSGEPIQVPIATMTARWNIGKDFFELGEGSVVQIQKAKIMPKARFEKVPHHIYSLELDVPLIPAQDFFDAIPRGLFSSVQGIRAQGELGFQMKAFLDTEQVDSVRFDAAMLQKGFRVNAWGAANPSILNTSFLHEPYEENFQAPAFRVGVESGNFVPLSSISSHLKNAILTTEDPSFFNHQGFLIESFRESIATNYKERAFKRGASTISMQLMKNVFLHRNKTVVRKLEEMLLVWLMENPRIVTKERQYEVYLNIIEFGRGIYGIKSGANYYFAKHPSQLTLGESLFLASIVPKPKRGMYFFDDYGRLRPYLASYFTFVGQIMARRGLIPGDESGDYGFHGVQLRSGLRPLPPEGPDSLDMKLPELNFSIPVTNP